MFNSGQFTAVRALILSKYIDEIQAGQQHFL